jgi:NAD(P)-dependent dehydrogenase (short-subunit alcohol dehydrogenase family)
MDFFPQELSTALSSEPGKLFPLKCDIIRETDIKDAFKWIKSNLGGVDILVNNAGVASENSLMGKES